MKVQSTFFLLKNDEELPILTHLSAFRFISALVMNFLSVRMTATHLGEDSTRVSACPEEDGFELGDLERARTQQISYLCALREYFLDPSEDASFALARISHISIIFLRWNKSSVLDLLGGP